VPRVQRVLRGLAGDRRTVPLALAMLAFGLFGASWLRSHWGVEETDNAQLQTHLVEIASRVPGTIAQVPVQENQAVQPGTPLVLLDRRDALAALRRAEADLLEARRQADALEAEAGSSLSGAAAAADQAAADQQVARAEVERSGSDLRRLEFLVRQGGVSRQEVDRARSAYRQALGQLTRSQGTALQARASQSKVGVEANFKETQLDALRPGQPAEISIDAFPGTLLHGHVLSVAPASGARFALLPPDNATGNFTKVVQRITARVSLENVPAALQGRLVPGLSATLAEVGWVVTGYAMASVVMIPLSEWLSELFGQRTYFVFCLVGFTASSMACGLAPNLLVLVLARIAQGVLGDARPRNPSASTAAIASGETRPPLGGRLRVSGAGFQALGLKLKLKLKRSSPSRSSRNSNSNKVPPLGRPTIGKGWGMRWATRRGSTAASEPCSLPRAWSASAAAIARPCPTDTFSSMIRPAPTAKPPKPLAGPRTARLLSSWGSVWR
jgi:membrane fusion protein (multidrug efflux system)